MEEEQGCEGAWTSKVTSGGVQGPMLWVDKYKPMKMEHLCGNGDKVKTLRNWLSNWGKPHQPDEGP